MVFSHGKCRGTAFAKAFLEGVNQRGWCDALNNGW
jgi:hypothetical protein